MFGFLRPDSRSKEYRALYCNTCRHLRSNYGVTSLPFLSYEAVLIHAIALDTAKISLAMPASRCKIIPFPNKADDENELHKTIGEFSSALTHLLLKIKLEDDVQDDNSWKAKRLRNFYNKNFVKCFEYFSALDSEFQNKVKAIIASHFTLETRGASIQLKDYAQPTADAFSYVFSLFGKVVNDKDRQNVYSRLGELVGRAIIYADCGFDWKKNKRKRAYNPVENTEMAVSAFVKSQEMLRESAMIAVDTFGLESITSKILLGVHDRLYRFAEKDRIYKKYLGPIKVVTDKAEEQASKGIVLASSICPSLALFAEGGGGGGDGCLGVCFLLICCSIIYSMGDKFCAGFENGCHNTGQGCGSDCSKC
ncbi:MAG: DUF5685 family protein [Thermoguttaceae bacterium]